MIAHDVKKLENYIACDDDTQSEIVVPCFVTVEDDDEDDEEDDGGFSGDAGGTGGASGKVKRRIKTILDIDSTKIGSFDEDDQRGLEKLLSLIYF